MLRKVQQYGAFNPKPAENRCGTVFSNLGSFFAALCRRVLLCGLELRVNSIVVDPCGKYLITPLSPEVLDNHPARLLALNISSR